MGTSSWLTTVMDQEMMEFIRLPQVKVAPRTALDSGLARKTGQEVSNELGGRYLLRYLLSHQVGLYRNGSNERQYATPTPYAPEETISWLALPAPERPRPFVLILDPSKIVEVLGPRWVRLGKGIEYILPLGFPREAIVFGWELEVK